ncbi:phage tail protein [Paenibacillus senegalimassiliensis]|uniref:phage tail protein n=1 Tax=Paenibacillus senegalimassiliensis TaxID=1737426 RepID=UPI00073F27E6|nr:phage tail protein [Paenibacillus senegalimassiliensis]
MAKTDWTLTDTVKPDDFNDIGREINQLRMDVNHIEVPTASLTEAGIVQLSNATDSTSEVQAATSKAVKAAYDLAQSSLTVGNERKQEVVDALIALGVTASMADSWDVLISKMSTVIKATGNATAADVLVGKTFSNAAGNNIAGTMPSLTGIRNATGVKWGESNLFVYPEKGYQKGGPGDGEIKVSAEQLQQVEPELKPSNIKKNVRLFNVLGTLIPSTSEFSVVNITSGGAVTAYAGQRQDIVLAVFPPETTEISYGGTSGTTKSYYQCTHSTNARMDFMIKDNQGKYWYLNGSAYGRYISLDSFCIFPQSNKKIVGSNYGGGLSQPEGFNPNGQLTLIYQIYSDVDTTVSYYFNGTVFSR